MSEPRRETIIALRAARQAHQVAADILYGDPIDVGTVYCVRCGRELDWHKHAFGIDRVYCMHCRKPTRLPPHLRPQVRYRGRNNPKPSPPRIAPDWYRPPWHAPPDVMPVPPGDDDTDIDRPIIDDAAQPPAFVHSVIRRIACLLLILNLLFVLAGILLLRQNTIDWLTSVLSQ